MSTASFVVHPCSRTSDRQVVKESAWNTAICAVFRARPRSRRPTISVLRAAFHVGEKVRELLLYRRYDAEVAQEVCEHWLGFGVVGVDLRERCAQARPGIAHDRPGLQVRKWMLGHPIAGAGHEERGLVGEMAVQR